MINIFYGKYIQYLNQSIKKLSKIFVKALYITINRYKLSFIRLTKFIIGSL